MPYKRKSTRIHVDGPLGKLAAILDMPDLDDIKSSNPAIGPKAYGIFSHCFSCTKDLKSIVKISRGLAEQGFGVVRFDFAGLGNSEGNFSDTNFLDNLADIRAVVSWMNQEGMPPQFLMGHSLGGSAMLATAMEFESVAAVSVIASPSHTMHLAETIVRLNPDVEKVGQAEVNTGTYRYLLKREMVEVLRRYDLAEKIEQLSKRLMVFHSPADSTLGFEHAERIVSTSAGPASLIHLEASNHLLTNEPRDCDLISGLLANWFERYLVETEKA